MQLLLICMHAGAQKNQSLQIIITDSANVDLSIFRKDIQSSKNYKDTAEVRQRIHEIIAELLANGFLAASADSIVRDSLSTKAFIFAGERYLWAYIKPGN